MGFLKDKDPEERRRLITALSLGYNLAAGMAICTFVGYVIGKRFGGGQGWILAGIFLGLTYCGYEVWKLIRQTK